MTDRELLELAAKAAGIRVKWEEVHGCYWVELGQGLPVEQWDPLADDGDALRLAVKLEIEVRNFNGKSHAGQQNKFWRTESWFPDGDPCATTRRAIVRAAAEIGKAMP